MPTNWERVYYPERDSKGNSNLEKSTMQKYLDHATAQKNSKKPKKLVISFAGTGCSAENPGAHKIAIEHAETNGIPVVRVNGVGQSNNTEQWSDTYVNASTHQVIGFDGTTREDAKNLNKHKLTAVEKGLSEGVLTHAISSAEGTMAQLGGNLIGYGLQSNIEALMITLKGLEEEGNLPDHICLAGYSRGAGSALVLANRIYKEFGNKIKLNLFLSDPVPGPQLGPDSEKHNIPPNVESVNIFYATSGLPNSPIDTFINPITPENRWGMHLENSSTIITATAIPGTQHNGFNSKEVESGHAAIMSAALQIKPPTNLSWDAAIDREKMVGDKDGARKGKVLCRINAGHSDNKELVDAIELTRSKVIKNYDRSHYDALMKIRGSILSSGFDKSEVGFKEKMNDAKKQGANYTKLGSFFSSSKIHVTKLQNECYELICGIKDEDPTSPKWEKAASKLKDLINTKKVENEIDKKFIKSVKETFLSFKEDKFDFAEEKFDIGMKK
ncbi:TPA: hypothetical protein JA361_14255 [Legionella pneumophila]|nr:hypothetical protein [Legionella pneumophila]HAT8182562.1 hypothetical protein [Legionella pneumophila]